MQENIVQGIVHILGRYKSDLFFEKKKNIWCWYATKKKTKKLVWYINTRSNDVVLGFSYYGTRIAEEYPMIFVLADEVKKSVVKRAFKTEENFRSRGESIITTIMRVRNNNK